MAEESANILPEDVPGTTLPPIAGNQARLKQLIKRRHPEYRELEEHWDFLEDTYEGGREWFENHIFPYVKEGPTEFEARKKRAYRFNHTREVVDLLNKYLFRMHVARNWDDAPEEVKAFWEKATRNGLGIDDLARQISRVSSIFGRVGVVVDNNMPDTPVTVAEVKEKGYGVYAYIVTAKQLLDYSYDDRGDLNWVLIEEAYRDDEDPFGDPKGTECRYRLWTKTSWYLFQEVKRGANKVVELVDMNDHGLGEVPVILHDHTIGGEEWHAPALIDEVAYLDRAIANYLSNLDAIIQDQTFSQLAMPAQNLMPGDEAYTKLLEMGTKRVFLYDGEGGAQPHYLSPDVKQAQLIVEAINKIINEIYSTVGLAGERTKEDNSVGIDNSSGVAKAYDFEKVNSLLTAKASSLEVTENKIARLVAKWHSKTVDKSLVQYPSDFDTRGLYDEFDIAARLILVEAPEEIRREQMRAVMEKLFPMIGEDKKNEMESALDKWPPDPIEQAAAMAEATNVAPKAPAGGSAPKAKKNNRQGQVTKNTK